MPKPLIAITVESDHNPGDGGSQGKLTLNWNYAEQVALAGGNPILIPPTADMVEIAAIIDGWLIPGGRDIDAKYFGQENHPEVVKADYSRYEAERRLYESAASDLPIFGICYGCQFLNVVRGGTLIQHLPDVVPTAHTGGPMQSYEVDPDSALAKFSKSTRIEGKSFHHQAVDAVGAGLAVVATGPDGVVEAIEASDRPWLVGVQWHPERTPEDKATRNLFREFVSAAARYKAKRMGAVPA